MKKYTTLFSLFLAFYGYAQQNDSLQTETLDEIVINNKYYKKYIKKEGSSSLRLNGEILKIPQNITIITNRALEDQQVTGMSDGVIRNVAGAQKLEHWGDLYTRINMRGSRAAAFLNGVNVTTPWGPLSEDMSFVDHIEFVKGPAGFLMSNGEPSGIYNIVTKKPTFNPTNGSARITLGSFDMYRGEVDIDTPISDKLAFRLNLMAQNRKSFRQYEFNDRYIINPTIAYKLSNKTKLTAEYLYQKAKMSEVGSAYVFSFDGYGTKPQSFTHTDPKIDPTNVINHTANINLQHDFNANWKLTSQLTYINEYTLGSDIWPSAFTPEGKMIRYLYFWEARNEMKFGQIFLNGYEVTGNVSHRILAGLDLGNKSYLADWNQGGALDKYNETNDPSLAPNYDYWYDYNTNNYGINGGFPYTSANNGYPTFDGNTTSLQFRATPYGTILQNYSGLYLQDELGFMEDQLRLTLAARYTQVTQNDYGTEKEAKKLTPRLGISYSYSDDLSFYGLYDQSFVPQAGFFRDGSTPDPILGNNLEIGIKKDWFGGKWMTTLSLYNINKENEIINDPTNQGAERFSIELGQTRVQGVEFDLKGEIAPGFNAIFNYAFTENTVTKSNDPVANPIGMRIPGYAKHTINGWLNYTVLQGDLEGLGFNVGGTFMGDRSTWAWASSGDQKPMDDYLKFDLGASWENKNVRVNFNVFNVLDRYLFSGSPFGNYYYYQAEAPRNYRLSIGYKF